LVATTSMCGAGASAGTDWSPLADKHVVILPDCDSDGQKYAEDVTKLLNELNRLPKSIRIVALPGLTKKQDAFDWIAQRDGRDASEIKEELLSFAANKDAEPIIQRGAVLKCFEDIEAKPINWFWDSRIPLGAITVISGLPGLGKSFITCDLAARISHGHALPDSESEILGSTIIASAEDSPEHVLKPRLEALGAKTSKVHFFEGIIPRTSTDDFLIPFKLEHVDELRDAILRLGDCKLLVIDPIGSYIGDIDAHRDNEVRSILTPINKLADDFQIAVLLVSHHRKGTSSNADDLTLGSRAFTGIARSVLHLVKDHDDPDRKLLLPGKSNLAQQADGLAFTIEGDPAKIIWEDEVLDLTADQW
ncbi:MAG: AAA family ATPase, partial [Planctomycetaceae bacterium]